MNDQEKLARQWAESTLSIATASAHACAAANHILATTAPPTMADVEWNDEKHHLAGATTPRGNDVVMMWCDDDGTGNIITGSAGWEPKDLTPNEKRYELVEVTDDHPEPSHPEVLRTVEDYENAPEGTLVGSFGYDGPFRKNGRGYWSDSYGYAVPNDRLADVRRTVRRWGWGE